MLPLRACAVVNYRREELAKMAEKSSKGKKGEMSQEKIIATFQQLRMEQRAIATKIAEIESDKNEHIIVMEALKKVDPSRKCFRMIGGVLVERTVKEVLPALKFNSEQLVKLAEKLMEQLTAKGKELNAFKLKHGIRIQEEGEQEDKAASSSNSDSKPEGGASQGVLIA